MASIQTHWKWQARVLALGSRFFIFAIWPCFEVGAQPISNLSSWPEPGSAIEKLPKLNVQGIDDHELKKSWIERHEFDSKKGRTSFSWEQAGSLCRTSFWTAKPTRGELPFMINFYDGRTGFAKINGRMLESRGGSGGHKFGSADIAIHERIPLHSFSFYPISSLAPLVSRARYIDLELKKTSQSVCGWNCRSYTAEAYLYWVGGGTRSSDGSYIKDQYSGQEGPREDLMNAYIEDRCYGNEFGTQLFANKKNVSLFEKIVSFFFSKG